VRGTGGPRDILPVLPMLAMSAGLYIPIVAALVVAWQRLSPWTLVLFLVPAAAAHRLYVLYHRERRLTAEVVTANAYLHRRDAILEAVSNTARRFLEPASLELAATEMLGELGRAAEAQHVCAYERASDGALTLRTSWSSAPGTPLPSAEELDAIAPVLAGRVQVGVLGLAGGDWSTAELDGLRAAAGILGAAIARAQTEEQLRSRDEQLRQSQKMEAIGRLAGGIAHDFNNLLTAIGGYAEMLVGSLADDDPRRRDAAEVRGAALRASALTGQLLAFSRKQVLAPEVVDVNTVLTESKRLLERVLGEDVDLSLQLDPALAQIVADPIQLHQIVLNLAVNARDAMPTGGRLVVRTANVGGRALTGGAAVLLEIADTGHGMDTATLERVFEPFFTTKEPGRGTGLGLATVHGIVEQSRGRIEVESEPGRGTVFRVYFPTSEGAEPAASPPLPRPLGGTETILLVEDEATVRRLAARILRDRGYTVVEAVDAEEALAVSDGHTGVIDLLLTDVVMPGLSGRELAERITKRRLFTTVVFMTGYTEDAIVHRGLYAASTVVAKPFTPDGLARAVREALDASRTRPVGAGSPPAGQPPRR
jgi:signal transduction histidine kinase/ActR/RegA family two-component response regulator